MNPLTDLVTDLEIIDAMATYGGSFSQVLAQACYCADPNNLERIKAAFPELWAEYAELAQARREADATAR